MKKYYYVSYYTEHGNKYVETPQTTKKDAMTEYLVLLKPSANYKDISSLAIWRTTYYDKGGDKTENITAKVNYFLYD